MNYNNNNTMKTMKLKTMAMAVVSALVMTASCSKEESVNPLLGNYKLSSMEVTTQDFKSEITNPELRTIKVSINDKFILNKNDESKVFNYSTNNYKLKLNGQLENDIMTLSNEQDYRLTADSLIISNVKYKGVSISYKLVKQF